MAAAGLIGFTVTPAQAADKDCADFATQRAAQIFFLNHGGPQNDPHGLDSEDDGVACESNPCPCYYGKTPPGGGGDSNPPPSTPEPLKRNQAKVIRVVDGDTVNVRILPRGPKVSVRLIGIDTPEVHGSTECGGPEASRSLKKLLKPKTRVSLLSDRSQNLKDRYGRWLRYVTKTKGKVDAGRRQLVRGHAEVYVFKKPFARVKSYRNAQTAAKRQDRGMWGNC
ncbi:thermonuclease family protein [Nocardioides dongkuii]|uniref:thermonuclease family protein n=1 Tax=Nocardioides dongkuii TaxID=2760089 RepID=UPI0029D41ACA|nr:thermonuclease family protein [Nocardioides dongkuii]